MGDRLKVNWEKVELAYRANVKTVAQIAKEFGLKDSTLRSRAKRNGWSRDLGKRIILLMPMLLSAKSDA